MERRRDGETERQWDGGMEGQSLIVSLSLLLSFSPSLQVRQKGINHEPRVDDK
jgi:hypothetical protein